MTVSLAAQAEQAAHTHDQTFSEYVRALIDQDGAEPQATSVDFATGKTAEPEGQP